MRLVRIEAGRFGRIDGRALGDLAPGLTVVHGPNEAGKSSLMALVRHVLYGFPTRGDAKESPYLSDAGAREGRLVFADDGGEWVVERREGAHGGPVTVRTLSGRSRDGLVAELTAGVSRLAYRVVFGFGLAEMQQIEELKGKDDDLIARLYAAGAGLTVSPIDVRASLQASMDALWAKRASTPELNRAKARRDELRGEIRALEARAEALVTGVSRLEALTREVDAARVLRTEAQVRAERATRVVAASADLLDQADALSEEASRLESEAEAAREQAAAIAVDQDVLAAADAVDELGVELSGFRERLASLSDLESRLATVEARLRGALDDAGWSEELALTAAADAGVAGEIDAHREALARASGRAEAAIEALDRARAGSAGMAAAPQEPGRPWLVPGAVVAAIGLVALLAGVVVAQTLFAAFGAVLVVAGTVLAFVGPGRRVGVGAAISSDRNVAVAEAEHAAASAALDEMVAAWSAWVRSRGLGDGSEDPKAVWARYQAARAARTADSERSGLKGSLARERAGAESYAERARAASPTAFGETLDGVALDRIPELVNRSVSKVAEVRDAAAARADALARADILARDASTARERVASMSKKAAAHIDGIGATTEGIDAARALETEVRSLAVDASDEFDRLSREATELRTALGAERRENALAELRLEEETIGERIAEGVREYAVLSVACGLLTRAQERYERDRQPEVVKRAEAAFASMTNGRYARIAVPLGKDAIEVFDAASAATSPGRLSRGTAEQLYLALRLGLIEQLGDAGRGLPVLMDDILVDFSPDRLEPAARAIADLASRRQVVFLTCHPAVADLMCRVAPDAVRLELDPPG